MWIMTVAHQRWGRVVLVLWVLWTIAVSQDNRVRDKSERVPGRGRTNNRFKRKQDIKGPLRPAANNSRLIGSLSVEEFNANPSRSTLAVREASFPSTISLPNRNKPVNILLILADDLGYGDLSVSPFTGSGIFTPELEKMAARGTILTNYHTAATVCSPTRASMLTGVYPWRLGISSVFEYGEKGKSNRDDFLVNVPTAPMIFSAHDYFTGHSGKWHLGGMRNDDLDMRLLPKKGEDGQAGGKRCPHPGPNQQGFEKYVSVLDGPGSPRQNFLQIEDKLYSHGCGYLLENDHALPTGSYNISGFLSYCEARHAMRYMDLAIQQKKPFYIHLWFHAPHGPWQTIPGYNHFYPGQSRPSGADAAIPCGTQAAKKARYCAQVDGNRGRVVYKGINRMMKYRTMVSDMDAQIGMVLRHLQARDIERDTLVIFTSDNGPEDGAGTTNIFRARKRHVYEGGIRVPAIAQWIGTIPAGGVSSNLVISTDVLPTFMEAAGIPRPVNLMIDGQSFLQDLLHAPVMPIVSHSSSEFTNHNSSLLQTVARGIPLKADSLHRDHDRHDLRKRAKKQQVIHERLLLWYNQGEGPERTISIFYGYKLLLNENAQPFEFFDLVNDPEEKLNILPQPGSDYWKKFPEKYPNLGDALDGTKVIKLKKDMLFQDRSNARVIDAIVRKIYGIVLMYARRGNAAYKRYLLEHPGILYKATPPSDTRHGLHNIYKTTTKKQMDDLVKTLLMTGSCGATPCSCAVPRYEQVPPLPYLSSLGPSGDLEMLKAVLVPSAFVNASIFLGL